MDKQADVSQLSDAFRFVDEVFRRNVEAQIQEMQKKHETQQERSLRELEERILGRVGSQIDELRQEFRHHHDVQQNLNSRNKNDTEEMKATLQGLQERLREQDTALTLVQQQADELIRENSKLREDLKQVSWDLELRLQEMSPIKAPGLETSMDHADARSCEIQFAIPNAMQDRRQTNKLPDIGGSTPPITTATLANTAVENTFLVQSENRLSPEVHDVAIEAPQTEFDEEIVMTESTSVRIAQEALVTDSALQDQIPEKNLPIANVNLDNSIQAESALEADVATVANDEQHVFDTEPTKKAPKQKKAARKKKHTEATKQAAEVKGTGESEDTEATKKAAEENATCENEDIEATKVEERAPREKERTEATKKEEPKQADGAVEEVEEPIDEEEKEDEEEKQKEAEKEEVGDDEKKQKEDEAALEAEVEAEKEAEVKMVPQEAEDEADEDEDWEKLRKMPLMKMKEDYDDKNNKSCKGLQKEGINTVKGGENRYNIAVVGASNAGKSWLLNAVFEERTKEYLRPLRGARKRKGEGKEIMTRDFNRKELAALHGASGSNSSTQRQDPSCIDSDDFKNFKTRLTSMSSELCQWSSLLKVDEIVTVTDAAEIMKAEDLKAYLNAQNRQLKAEHQRFMYGSLLDSASDAVKELQKAVQAIEDFVRNVNKGVQQSDLEYGAPMFLHLIFWMHRVFQSLGWFLQRYQILLDDTSLDSESVIEHKTRFDGLKTEFGEFQRRDVAFPKAFASLSFERFRGVAREIARLTTLESQLESAEEAKQKRRIISFAAATELSVFEIHRIPIPSVKRRKRYKWRKDLVHPFSNDEEYQEALKLAKSSPESRLKLLSGQPLDTQFAAQALAQILCMLHDPSLDFLWNTGAVKKVYSEDESTIIMSRAAEANDIWEQEWTDNERIERGGVSANKIDGLRYLRGMVAGS